MYRNDPWPLAKKNSVKVVRGKKKEVSNPISKNIFFSSTPENVSTSEETSVEDKLELLSNLVKEMKKDLKYSESNENSECAVKTLFKSAEKDLKDEELNGKFIRSSKSLRITQKIQDFLNENPTRSFRVKEIAAAIDENFKLLQAPLKYLAEISENIKIVGFYEDGRRLSPYYQSLQGPLPAVHLIEEGSKEFVKLDLVSIREFSTLYNDRAIYPLLLRTVEASKIPSYITICKNGFFKKYKVFDLKNLLKKHTKLSQPEYETPTKQEKVLKLFGYQITLRKI